MESGRGTWKDKQFNYSGEEGLVLNTYFSYFDTQDLETFYHATKIYSINFTLELLLRSTRHRGLEVEYRQLLT